MKTIDCVITRDDIFKDLELPPAIAPRLAFTKRFVSYHRFLLDHYLEATKPLLRGDVVDMGGQKKNRRGNFRPPLSRVRSWQYLNSNPIFEPDILADASSTGLPSASVDFVICCEMLEHVSDPKQIIAEIRRILRPGGCLIASTPFLYRLHADPDDFHRFTESAIHNLSQEFSVIKICAMGHWAGTVGMFIEQAVNDTLISLWTRPLRWMLKCLSRTLVMADLFYYEKSRPWNQSFTTGYFWIAQK